MTNRQLLGAVVALAALATLLCIGVLFGQRGRAAEVRSLERELQKAARERTRLDRDLDRLHAALVELHADPEDPP